jgi:5-methyltetrahydropteroyltriglutamate--homocysteine methyltransferase
LLESDAGSDRVIVLCVFRAFFASGRCIVPIFATSLGFSRIGAGRELKKALESFWKGASSKQALLDCGAELRARHWKLQQAAGLDHIPSNDFSLYDQVLDLCCMLGCVPRRYDWHGGAVDLDTYFAMARGRQSAGSDVTAMEMSKWFDTNYHYLVPEFSADQQFALSSEKILDEYREARALGIETRPVLIGPLTFASIGKKAADAGYSRSTLIAKLVPVYVQILNRLRDAGAQWVQMDEPALVLDMKPEYRQACAAAYRAINAAVPGLKILVASYFDSLRDNQELAFSLPVAGVHIDLCRGPGQANTYANDADRLLDQALSLVGDKVLSLGLVDGRNIWRNDLSASLQRIEKAAAKLGPDRVMVAPSCSLLHVPVDLNPERHLDPKVRGWMAFGVQKLDEVVTLAWGIRQAQGSIAAAFAASDAVQTERKTSTRIHDGKVQARLKAITSGMKARRSPFAARREIADFCDSRSSRGLQEGRSGRDRLSQCDEDRDPDSRGLSGANRARRPGPWRGRTQRYGGVLRRTAQRVCIQRAGLGAIVRVAMRETADHIRRCVASGADDGGVGHLCPKSYRQGDEGNADRAGHHPAMVVRAR